MPRQYTVSDAIIDTLIAHNITHLFGYPGGAILPFYDCLPHHTELKHVLVRNEQGAAFAAQGWARSTKQIGVCVSTSGPGATNLITGIADAYCDSIPILAITGQVPLHTIGKDMFQEVDMTGVTLNITKHNFLADNPKDIVKIVTEAIAIATSGRPGPVHIDLPKDISTQPHPKKFIIPKIDFSKSDPSMQAYKPVETSILDKIINTLNKAKRPILLIGQGVKHSNAEDKIINFINKTRIPTISTLLAKGCIPEDHPNYYGYIGMHGYYHANIATHEADVIINIGSRFDDRIVGRYDVFGQHAKIIHIDIDKAELNKVVKTEIPVQADARQFTKQLLAHPNLKKLKIENWIKKIDGWRKDFPYKKETKNFSTRTCLSEIDKIVKENPEKYILITDVGQHQMWSMLSLSANSSTKWLSSGGAGTMGFSLPTAIGAAFANPDKTVIVIGGDGGTQMNIQEFGTIANYGLNIKTFVLNNNFLGMVRQWQDMFYNHNYSGVAMTSPNYAILGKAYGIPAKIVKSKNDLNKDLKKILESKGPRITECRVEKEDNVLPMVPGGKHLGETII